MAKSFELVSAADLSALVGRLSTNGKEGKELVSNYVLSALKHFGFNGKKIDVLQTQIDEILAVRPRDFDVIEMSIRLLSPVKVKADKKAKKIVIEGLPSQNMKADATADAKKKKSDAENAFFRGMFTAFVQGEEVEVANPDFYDGVNKDKVAGAADVVPEKIKEQFNQCVFEYCARIKEIGVLKADAKAAREKAAKEAAGETVHTRIDTNLIKKTGGYKPVIDSKISGVIEAITAEHLATAEAVEVKELASAVVAYERELEKLQTKLNVAKGLLADKDAEIKGQAKAAAAASFTDEELAAILAARQASNPATA